MWAAACAAALVREYKVSDSWGQPAVNPVAARMAFSMADALLVEYDKRGGSPPVVEEEEEKKVKKILDAMPLTDKQVTEKKVRDEARAATLAKKGAAGREGMKGVPHYPHRKASAKLH